MYTKRNYGFWLTFNWSRKPFYYGLVYTLAIAIVSHYLQKHFNIDITLPWQPISVLGISVAFYLGFKNNSSYDRLWEARKIWGGIVNSSRSFGSAICSFVAGDNEEAIKKELIYRHVAWLTALRYQLRLSRSWEHINDRMEGYPAAATEEYKSMLEAETIPYIGKEEFNEYIGKTNIATQILNKQACRLQELHNGNYFDTLRHIELFTLLKSFYDEQGKSERIKNFPFPRQYASVAVWTTMMFTILMPFGIISIFKDVETDLFWVCVPLSALVNWIFFLMEKIGDYSENTFEATYNDIPISSISRSIDIDLREMIGDSDIPKAIVPNEMGYLM